ncbi:hypothetical protein [Aquimarina intermedia]|uniref:Uncharacterized protein n=1 Tax=Aquimarina intermedia TaxID=350814 RepID=A0A5S5BY99_9FLAO|nr:hypothetical protein [Aquimarina intermedia]TYP72131.1 hypothetical protein BD809_10715 [Aquimarina intermedia]
MKKFITYIAIFCLLSCSSDDQDKQNSISIQLNFDQISEYANDYTFSDFKIKIYSTKEDYFNETNPVFSGDFDTTGAISISENIAAKSYYVDIYSTDKVLSNWEPSDLDVDSSNIIVFYPSNGGTDFFQTVYITDTIKVMGTWSFSTYDYTNSDNPEKTIKTSLSINKDFTVQSHESYNDIDLVLNFELESYTSLNITNIEPDDQSYPALYTNRNALSLQVDELGFLYFYNYAGENTIYSKN